MVGLHLNSTSFAEEMDTDSKSVLWSRDCKVRDRLRADAELKLECTPTPPPCRCQTQMPRSPKMSVSAINIKHHAPSSYTQAPRKQQNTF